MAAQGLAEYVALNATRAGSTIRVAFRNAVEVVSDNFLVVVAVMVAIVLLYTFSLSKPR